MSTGRDHCLCNSGGQSCECGRKWWKFLVTGINVKVIMAGGNVTDEVTFNPLADIPSHSSDKLVAPVLHPAKKHNEARKLCEHKRQRSGWRQQHLQQHFETVATAAFVSTRG